MIAALTLPTTVPLPRGTLALRRAVLDDIAPLARLLADDEISATRGDRAADDDLDAYRDALGGIVADGSNDLVVGSDGDQVVAVLQLTRIPGLSRRGTTRLQVEAVRVASDRRSAGIGTAFLRWVLDVAAPAVGAGLVQLTSDSARGDAHRFYEALGFTASHVGFKRIA
ncbi:GNAT family N-acetyltransferase [Cellulomonas triticagri]|uniref:GNAT family N-acetyltransferase n=1 Tax=Cellulomonas triticagri TaxID=2483352 RepID=A0A3M2JSV8_9CELL|nr:GNAT family N-acetyltransferase [Cellulomonas triticagri]RMI13825.1 GNAT family N-acetyltransferase [Cellulomonas triticagri]